MEGKIVKGIAGFFYVRTADGLVWQCRAKGVFRREGVKPLVGDDVSIEITHEGDKEGNIVAVHDRRNEALRPPVANVDQAALLFAVKEPDVSHYLLGRFLIMAQKMSLPVTLCFNKCDLATDEETDALRQIYRNCGCEVLFLSVRKRTGLDGLYDAMRGKTTVLAGPSGVGKSSLINALIGETVMETGGLSKKIARGKNTTRHSELFALPEDDGYVCDTPGFMSLKPEGVEPKDLHLYYPEFEPYEASCRFATCTHIAEPDCAVLDALKTGAIDQTRYDAYRLLYDELSGDRPVYEKKIKKA